MEIRKIQDHGIVTAGHTAPRSDLLAQARQQLVADGMSPWDAEESVIDRPGLVARAWMASDDVGFCGEDHPDARPVTVVNLCVPTPAVTAPAKNVRAVG